MTPREKLYNLISRLLETVDKRYTGCCQECIKDRKVIADALGMIADHIWED